MLFKEGTHVYTADSEDVGELARVVVDPRTKQVTHIAVRQGFLFTEDKVIPVDLVGEANEDHVTLTRTKDLLPEFPLFVETHYVVSEEDEVDVEANPLLYSYPPLGALSWGYDLGYPAYVLPPYEVEVERNVPEGSVILSEGAQVYSADGQQAGEIEKIITEPGSRRITHLVISKGWLFREHKAIPAGWIIQAQDDAVRLAVPARVLEGLPDYAE